LNSSPIELGIVSIGKPDKSNTARYFGLEEIEEYHEDNALLVSNVVRSLDGSMFDGMPFLHWSTATRRESDPTSIASLFPS
jgi:hypothetical protein